MSSLSSSGDFSLDEDDEHSSSHKPCHLRALFRSTTILEDAESTEFEEDAHLMTRERITSDLQKGHKWTLTKSNLLNKSFFVDMKSGLAVMEMGEDFSLEDVPVLDFQFDPSPSPSHSLSNSLKEKDDIETNPKVKDVLREIFKSETGYQVNMKVLKDFYFVGLLNLRDSFPELQDLRLDVMFSIIKQIYNLHKVLFLELNTLNPVSLKHVVDVCDIFIEFCLLLRIYAQYAQMFEMVSSILNDLRASNEKFVQELARLQNDPKSKNQMIDSYLVMPIQRIPQYTLLLKELVSNLDVDSIARERAELALKKISESGVYINSAIHLREKRETLAEIENQFNGSVALLQYGRHFVKSGQLQKITRNGKPRTYTFHLFNDLLLYSEELSIGSVLQMRRRLDLATASVDLLYDDQATKIMSKMKLSSEDSNSLYLFVIKSSQKSFVVAAKTDEERYQWINEINRQIMKIKLSSFTPTSSLENQLHSLQNPADVSSTERLTDVKPSEANADDIQAPIWFPDQNACAVCNKPFAITRRRHHCRKCGACVCDACSPHKIFLKHISDRAPVRACSRCFESLAESMSSPSFMILNSIRSPSASKMHKKSPSLVFRDSNFSRNSHSTPSTVKNRIPRFSDEESGTDSVGSPNEMIKDETNLSVTTRSRVYSSLLVPSGETTQSEVLKSDDVSDYMREIFVHELRVFQIYRKCYGDVILQLASLLLSPNVPLRKFKFRPVLNSNLAVVLNDAIQCWHIFVFYFDSLKTCFEKYQGNPDFISKVLRRIAKLTTFFDQLQESLIKSVEDISNPALNEFLNEMGLHSPEELSLHMILRIPIMWFRNLIRVWGHLDFSAEELSSLKNTVRQINNTFKISCSHLMNSCEDRQRILMMLGQWFDKDQPIITSGDRNLIDVGFCSAKVHVPDSPGEWKHYFFHIFNDILILSSPDAFPKGYDIVHLIFLAELALNPKNTSDSCISFFLGRNYAVDLYFYEHETLTEFSSIIPSAPLVKQKSSRGSLKTLTSLGLKSSTTSSSTALSSSKMFLKAQPVNGKFDLRSEMPFSKMDKNPFWSSNKANKKASSVSQLTKKLQDVKFSNSPSEKIFGIPSSNSSNTIPNKESKAKVVAKSFLSPFRGSTKTIAQQNNSELLKTPSKSTESKKPNT